MSDLPPDEIPSGFEDESFDEGKKSTLGELWRTNTMFKVGMVVAAAVIVFGAIILFGGSSSTNKSAPSVIAAGSDIAAAPGTEAASPAYIDAVKEQNDARTEQAIREGNSSLPTPIEPPVGRLSVPDDTSESAEDPLQRWRKLQEERLQREMQKTQAVAPQADTQLQQQLQNNHEEAVRNMSDVMSQQMQSILESRNQVKMNYQTVTDPSWLETQRQKQEQVAQKAAAAAASSRDSIEQIIIPAGQIAYAQVITEANSDVPGPVLAQLASGPLSGGRLIGSFQKQKELLTLNFNTIVLDGVSYNVSAIALDPDTTLPAMATDVDHHYLRRIVLPMAAQFVTGMADAIAQSGKTDITVTGQTVASSQDEPSKDQEVGAGVDKAGEKLSKILDDMADEYEETVRIETGTPIGVLFLEPVVKSDDTQAQLSTTNDARRQAASDAAAASLFSGTAGGLPGANGISQAQQALEKQMNTQAGSANVR